MLQKIEEQDNFIIYSLILDKMVFGKSKKIEYTIKIKWKFDDEYQSNRFSYEVNSSQGISINAGYGIDNEITMNSKYKALMMTI